MKYGIGIICALARVAAAQTAASPAPQHAPSSSPQPALAPQPQPPGDTPSWLPGVQDVTGAEIEEPGKVKLSMTRAVELAVRQHPTLRQARAAASAAAARIDLAHVPLHPTVNTSANLTTGSSRGTVSATDPTVTATGGGFFGTPQLNTGLAASAAWRIYDFGQTRASIRAAEASSEAAQASINTSVLDIRASVETSYLEAIARQRLVLVAQATVKSEEGHLDQARRFVAAGAHDPIEVAQAQSRAANARSTLAQAQSNEAVALANLRAAIGWVDATRALTIDPSWPQIAQTEEPPALQQLVETARARRPEIVQFDKQIIASEANVDAAHDERRPVLSAVASTQWNPGQGNWSPEPTWLAGLTLSWQLWDGGRSAADVKIAQANLMSTQAQRDELLVQLTSGLESARAQIIANRANVQASTEAVAAAQASLNFANARYTQGLGSQIELADAQTAVTTAQGNLVAAEWQLADAWANLGRAIGQL